MECVECIKRNIPDNSVNLVFCDLPYNISAGHEWDSYINLDVLFAEYKRVLKKGGTIVLTATEPFRTNLIISGRDIFKYDLIWLKNKSTGFLNAKKQPMRIHESILVFQTDGGTKTYNPQKTSGHKAMNSAKKASSDAALFGAYGPAETIGGRTDRYPTSVLKFNVVNNDSPDRAHPSQKPAELCEWVVKTYSNEGDVVLDNCFGSGSAIIACKKLNRKFIGIEMNEQYFRQLEAKIQSI